MIDYDMHIHSCFSDGVLEPEEILLRASNYGLKGLAVTDHDTINALKQCEQLSHKYALDFIPGIELSTEYNEMEIHILGYYIDYEDAELVSILNNIREERIKRIKKMIINLNKMGYEVSLEDVYDEVSQKLSGNAIGRPHLARALLNKGYFKTMNEVFNKLLGNGKPAYVERYKLEAIDGIKLIRRFNGIPVLAHPGLIKVNQKQLEEMVRVFTDNGLMGLEIYHTEHREFTSLFLSKLARKYKLNVTGGSDFHASSSLSGNSKEIFIGYRGVPAIEVARLKKAHSS